MVSVYLHKDPYPSSDALRLQRSDDLESGRHAVRSPVRIVRWASVATPDRCPAAPPRGSLAYVLSTRVAGRPVPTYDRSRLPGRRRTGTEQCWYYPYLPSGASDCMPMPKAGKTILALFKWTIGEIENNPQGVMAAGFDTELNRWQSSGRRPWWYTSRRPWARLQR